MERKELREKAMKLPLLPGVYIMKNSRDEIIYIGKAKALKNRVSQYFGSQKHHPEKVRQMVYHVDHFEYILCSSEFEALVLECSLIKQHQPKYNILLKDDKGYCYIRISNEAWRKIRLHKGKEHKQQVYALKEVTNILITVTSVVYHISYSFVNRNQSSTHFV